jgi:hypothetical protein
VRPRGHGLALQQHVLGVVVCGEEAVACALTLLACDN